MAKDMKKTTKESKSKEVESSKKETKKEKKNNIHEITIKIEGKEWNAALDKALRLNKKQLKLMVFVKEKFQEIFMKNILEKNLYF